jgi:methionine synthase reductase
MNGMGKKKVQSTKKTSQSSSAKKPSVIVWQSGGTGKTKRPSSTQPVEQQLSYESVSNDNMAVRKDTRAESLIETQSKVSAKDKDSGGTRSAAFQANAMNVPSGSTLLEYDRLITALRANNFAVKVSKLTLPALPRPFLEVQYTESLVSSPDLSATKQYASSYPSQATDLFMAPITACQQLTSDDAIKTALEVQLDTKGSGVTYMPGDSFSVVCENEESEVEWLLNRLDLTSVADTPATLKIMANTQAKHPSIPIHLPKSWTPRGWLQNCCDIRCVPKKMFLRQLAEYTSDPEQKTCILQLCSRQGSVEYGSLIREQFTSFLDILDAFPSCMPILSIVLEGLPRLQPRPYSVTSSPYSCEDKARCVFNIVNFPPKQIENRKGVCTGWLERLTERFRRGFDALDQPATPVENPPKIPIFLRVNNRFKIPEDSSVPLLMIGPGTGIAPFVGFLDHRQEQQIAAKFAGMKDVKFGETWLFFGCRHKERDFLYRFNMPLTHFNYQQCLYFVGRSWRSL